MGDGATLIVGCEPGFYACSDDPGGTASGNDRIGGNLVANYALGVVVHAHLGRRQRDPVVRRRGSDPADGRPGLEVRRAPPGPYAMTGVYSDYEDDTLGGSLQVTGVRTCWFGMLRNKVPGNLVVSNNMFSDPDANEVMQNSGRPETSPASGNSPAVQYGDSSATPNKVTGNASGECSFTRVPGPPVSVKA